MMEPDDYCDIFCSHLMTPEHHPVVGDYHRYVPFANGEGLGFGRIERYHDILMGTNTLIFHFDYLPCLNDIDTTFIILGFRLAITIHHVDDLEIEDTYL